METVFQVGSYRTTLINNRRYLGNKYKLLSFITDVVDAECTGVEVIADISRGRARWPPRLPTGG